MTGKEASDIIEEALNKVLANNEDYEEGDVLVDWAVIAYTANPDQEKGGAYPTFFSNGNIPNYRRRGLFLMGLVGE